MPIVQAHLATRRYAHTDVSAVTPFLDQTLDGRNLPWHGAKDGISGTNPEQNPNNKAPQKRPKRALLRPGSLW